jgi:hypothetical protein
VEQETLAFRGRITHATNKTYKRRTGLRRRGRQRLRDRRNIDKSYLIVARVAALGADNEFRERLVIWAEQIEGGTMGREAVAILGGELQDADCALCHRTGGGFLLPVPIKF